ncbi:DNA helicase, partial [Burkholderia multivorans]
PGQLYPGLDTEISDDPVVAEIKGRSAMARVLAHHIANYERVPEHDERLRVGAHTVLLRRKDVRSARERARRSGDPHNAARTGFVSGLLKTLAEDLAVQMGLDGAGERL